MATRRTYDICQREVPLGYSPARLEYDPGDLKTMGEDRLELDLCMDCKKLIYLKLAQLIDEMQTGKEQRANENSIR